MVSQVDQQRVCALLTEAVTVICKNGLSFNNKFNIEGLLGITMDDRNMFLVNIKETIIKGGGNQSHSTSKSGMYVGVPPQANSGRGPIGVGGRGHGPTGGRGGAGPMSVPRPGTASTAAPTIQHQLQRRRPGGPPQHILPTKRPATMPPAARATMPPNVRPSNASAAPVIGRGAATDSGNMPQEWAALLQLQQGAPPGRGSGAFVRGRGRATARRGGPHRGQGPRGKRGQLTAKEMEALKEQERKAAEQARLRSERLERRRSAGGTWQDTAPNEMKGTDGDNNKANNESDKEPDEEHEKIKTSTDQGVTERKPPTHEDDMQEEKAQTDDDDASEDKVHEEDSTEGDENIALNNSHHNTREDTSQSPSAGAAVKEERSGKSGQGTVEKIGPEDISDDVDDPAQQLDTETDHPDGNNIKEPPSSADGGSQETRADGDGSWLLSNSSWLLGELDAVPTPGTAGVRGDHGSPHTENNSNH